MNITRKIKISDRKRSQTPCGLFVCDFDGTLLRSDRTFSKADLDGLKLLGSLGVIRIIATGRSIYSINTIPISELPMDYIIFSSGAGIVQHPGGHIIRKVSLEPHKVDQAIQILQACCLDFMVHPPIPENHAFSYFEATSGNLDFHRRIESYRQFATPLAESTTCFGPATQLLAVLPPADNRPIIDRLRAELPDCNVIQTTSPLDGQSTWIEIFPATVSKSHTTAWISEKLGLNRSQTLSIGNDYNDLDLLKWTATSFVVENAPDELKKQFPVVASNNESGVAEAVHRWLATDQFRNKQ